MLDRQKGKIAFECDSCHEALETDVREFDDALSVLKAEGWYPYKTDSGTWEHYCSACWTRRR